MCCLCWGPWWDFLFWWFYRFTLASLAHFNWFMALYTNCAYFSLWKSYDLLWFWSHLVLCACFASLRPENYLLVWANIIHKQRTKYPTNSCKQVYLWLYARPGTKTERRLERLQTIERHERESRRSKRLAKRGGGAGAASASSPLLEENEDEGSHENRPSSSATDPSLLAGAVRTLQSLKKKHVPPIVGQGIKAAKSARQKSRIVNFTLEDSDEDNEEFAKVEVAPGPHDNSDSDSGESDISASTNSEDVTPLTRPTTLSVPKKPPTDSAVSPLLTPDRPAVDSSAENANSDTSDAVSWMKKVRDRLNPAGTNSSNSPDSPTSSITWTDRVKQWGARPFAKKQQGSTGEAMTPILRPDFTNDLDISDPKRREKAERRAKQQLQRKVRTRLKKELREKIEREKQRKKTADAIELLLQLLRIVCTFAVLAGNIRKLHFHFNRGKMVEDHAQDDQFDIEDAAELEDIWLALMYRATIFMEVAMFLLAASRALCAQLNLCCRLGFVRFWAWAVICGTVMGLTMLLPMFHVQEELDVTWCRFKSGSPLERFQPDW